MYLVIVTADSDQLTEEMKEALEKLTEVLNKKPEKDEVVVVKKKTGRPKKETQLFVVPNL